MTSRSPLPAVSSTDEAVAQLKYIRQTIDRARPFTAVSGTGLALMGVVALVASVVAGRLERNEDWLATWLMAAAFASLVGAAANYWKGRTLDLPFRLGPFRQMAGCFVPPMAAGALLTFVLAMQDAYQFLPGVWLLLYGAAVIAGGNFSVQPVRILGCVLMSMGAVAFVIPGLYDDVLLGLGFGAVQVAFGICIARRYGG